VRTKIFVDTLFLVALLNKRDQYHQKALKLAQEFDGYPLVTTDAIFLEVGNALAGSYKQEAVALMRTFLTAEEVKVIRLNESLFNQALQLYQDHQDKSWGLVDCVSFMVMRDNQVTQALTFDKHFVQAGFQALMR
jgi:hypothetical protein